MASKLGLHNMMKFPSRDNRWGGFLARNPSSKWISQWTHSLRGPVLLLLLRRIVYGRTADTSGTQYVERPLYIYIAKEQQVPLCGW